MMLISLIKNSGCKIKPDTIMILCLVYQIYFMPPIKIYFMLVSEQAQ